MLTHSLPHSTSHVTLFICWYVAPLFFCFHTISALSISHSCSSVSISSAVRNVLVRENKQNCHKVENETLLSWLFFHSFLFFVLISVLLCWSRRRNFSTALQYSLLLRFALVMNKHVQQYDAVILFWMALRRMKKSGLLATAYLWLRVEMKNRNSVWTRIETRALHSFAVHCFFLFFSTFLFFAQFKLVEWVS